MKQVIHAPALHKEYHPRNAFSPRQASVLMTTSQKTTFIFHPHKRRAPIKEIKIPTPAIPPLTSNELAGFEWGCSFPFRPPVQLHSNASLSTAVGSANMREGSFLDISNRVTLSLGALLTIYNNTNLHMSTSKTAELHTIQSQGFVPCEEHMRCEHWWRESRNI